MSLFVRYQPVVLGSGGSGIVTGDLTDSGTDGITVTNGTGAVVGSGTQLSQHVADSSHNGYLSSTDWSTFNAKQPAGNYLTALTGDGTATGPGSAALTLATVNSNVGSFSPAAITVNAKGLVTAASSATTGDLTDVGTDGITVTGGTGAVLGSGTSISQHVADTTHNGYLSSTDWNTFNGKQAAGNYLTALTGDGTASGPGSSALTLATVNSNVGSFTYASITVNAKGLITAASSGAAPLSNPMTTLGDIIYGGASGAVTRLAGDTSNSNRFLRSVSSAGTAAAPSWQALVAGDVPNLAASIITSGTLATARGGTNLDSSASTGVAKVASGTWSVAAVAGTDFGTQSANTYFGGPLSGSAATPTFRAFTAVSLQKFTSTGTTVGYVFTVTSANATVGATYTNNTNTYTVVNTIAAGTILFCSGASAPQASGTLTKSAGTGDSTITFSAANAYATYTAPTSPPPLYLKIRMVGGGGGSGGSSSSGNNDAGTGGTGKTSYFGANLLSASGGTGAAKFTAGSGGAASLGSGPVGGAFTGSAAQQGIVTNGNTFPGAGGMGGSTPFGGAGLGNNNGANAGAAAAANTGSGAGGASSSSGGISGGGGGASGYIDAIITSPATTYPYVVGTGGAAGGAGTGGAAGAAGADGIILIEEHYQ